LIDGQFVRGALNPELAPARWTSNSYLEGQGRDPEA
jgi:hypothetical protein